MTYVIADINVQHKTPVGAVVELKWIPVMSKSHIPFYASCVVSPVEEPVFVSVTYDSLFCLLHELSSKMEQCVDMEDNGESYTDEYIQLCKDVEALQTKCMLPRSDVKLSPQSYAKIESIVLDIARTCGYYGQMLDLDIRD